MMAYPKGITSVREHWDAFTREVMPPDAGRLQRSEMRRAFYAGAWAMFCTAAGEVSLQSDENGVLALEALKAECQMFAQAVERGEA